MTPVRPRELLVAFMAAMREAGVTAPALVMTAADLAVGTVATKVTVEARRAEAVEATDSPGCHALLAVE